MPIVRVNNFKDGCIDVRHALTIDPEVEAKYQRSRLQGGELLLTLVGTMGLSAIAPDELHGWNVARAVGVVPLKKDVDERWLNFVLRSQPSQDFIETHANTTVQPTFNLRDLARLPVPMPPASVRQPASELLSALDDKIELNRRMNETLEAMARAIFKDWFVDFGPTRAKAEGRAPYLAPELWDLFPDTLDNEGKPVGWELSKVGSKIQTKLGGTPSRKNPEYWAGEIPWINSGKVNEFRVVSPAEFITTQGLENSATKLLPKRTTLIAITGATLGQVSLNEIEVCTNQSIVGAVGNKEIPGEFLYLWVIENIDDLLASQTGAAQQHINKRNVNDLALLCPHRSVMEAWIEIARPIFDQIAVQCFECKTLAQTRDLLLPKLMSGEIRLRDAERVVGAVA